MPSETGSGEGVVRAYFLVVFKISSSSAIELSLFTSPSIIWSKLMLKMLLSRGINVSLRSSAVV